MSKYAVKHSKAFKKELKKLKNDSQALAELEFVIDKLANDEILAPKYKDHQLTGDLKAYRECHIRPNLLLIYEKQEDILLLTCINLGSHSKLFKK